MVLQSLPKLRSCSDHCSVVLVTARPLLYVHEKMETLASCVEMSELEENEARSWLVYHAAPSNHVSEDVLRQYLQRCYFRNDVGYDHCLDGLEVLVLQREDDDAGQGRVDSQAQAQESLEHPILSVGRKSFHKHPIYSILKKSFDALSEEDQMLFMDAALFYPRRSSHDPSWNFNTLDWMHIVHGGSVEDIEKRVCNNTVASFFSWH